MASVPMTVRQLLDALADVDPDTQVKTVPLEPATFPALQLLVDVEAGPHYAYLVIDQ